jgi:hypothetical protein
MSYKVKISRIESEAYDETDYKNTHKKDEKGEDVWAHVPTGLRKTRNNERPVFEQEVEDLDMSAVVVAVNTSLVKR